jgi:hypothetical protein
MNSFWVGVGWLSVDSLVEHCGVESWHGTCSENQEGQSKLQLEAASITKLRVDGAAIVMSPRFERPIDWRRSSWPWPEISELEPSRVPRFHGVMASGHDAERLAADKARGLRLSGTHD